jgi:hypothetical protein
MPAVMVRGFRSSLVVAALACGVLLVGGVAEGRPPCRAPSTRSRTDASPSARAPSKRERTGERVFDLNRDGVAQYGLYADLLAYVRRQPGGLAAEALLFRGAEAYLRTWERAMAAPRSKLSSRG